MKYKLLGGLIIAALFNVAPASAETVVHRLSGACIHPEGGQMRPGNNTPLVLHRDGCNNNEQRLQFKLLGNGALQHVPSGKCLHPNGGSARPGNGTVAVLHDGCNGDRLKFRMVRNTLQHVTSGKCLHPSGGAARPQNGTKLVFWSGCGEERLAFRFVGRPTPPPPPPRDYRDQFLNGASAIRLVTPRGLNVNLPHRRNGGMINTFKPDNTDDWQFKAIRTAGGLKFQHINSNYLITAKDYPSRNMSPLEAYKDAGGEDPFQTWVVSPANRSGFFNICLKAQPTQCMNVPNSGDQTKLTTFEKNPSDPDQMFRAEGIQLPPPPPPVTLHSNPTPRNPLTGFLDPLSGGGNYSHAHHEPPFQYSDDLGTGGKMGVPIRAMRAGKVVHVRDSISDLPVGTPGGKSNWRNSNYVVIEYDQDSKHSSGHHYRSLYLHIQKGSAKVRVGERVQAGQVIAAVGHNGWSSGPHLHVEVNVPYGQKHWYQRKTVPYIWTNNRNR